MTMTPVRVPTALQGCNQQTLERYVENRITAVAGPFARRVGAAHMTDDAAAAIVREVMMALPPPEVNSLSIVNKDLQLFFRHDCLSTGCNQDSCKLCEHNTSRRCKYNFDKKYLVQDVLKAKCGAAIRVEVIDKDTGVPYDEDMPGVSIEIAVLDGRTYDPFSQSTDLADLLLLTNKKGNAPLLASGTGADHTPDHKVSVPLVRGRAELPSLSLTDSSEAILSGSKPPLRLLVVVKHSDGRPLAIRHAVSEPFIVATRRTQTARKADIPRMEDSVSKLEHLGKETVKKLEDLRRAAKDINLELPADLPVNTVTTVEEYRTLVKFVARDSSLRQKLQQILKLSKARWDEARDHALKAVKVDSRLRIWRCPDTAGAGLLFAANLGAVDFDAPLALVNSADTDGEFPSSTPLEALTAEVRTWTLKNLLPAAKAAWWQPDHPSWDVLSYDSDAFARDASLVPMTITQSLSANGSGPAPGSSSGVPSPPEPTTLETAAPPPPLPPLPVHMQRSIGAIGASMGGSIDMAALLASGEHPGASLRPAASPAAAATATPANALHAARGAAPAVPGMPAAAAAGASAGPGRTPPSTSGVDQATLDSAPTLTPSGVPLPITDAGRGTARGGAADVARAGACAVAAPDGAGASAGTSNVSPFMGGGPAGVQFAPAASGVGGAVAQAGAASGGAAAPGLSAFSLKGMSAMPLGTNTGSLDVAGLGIAPTTASMDLFTGGAPGAAPASSGLRSMFDAGTNFFTPSGQIGDGAGVLPSIALEGGVRAGSGLSGALGASIGRLDSLRHMDTLPKDSLDWAATAAIASQQEEDATAAGAGSRPGTSNDTTNGESAVRPAAQPAAAASPTAAAATGSPSAEQQPHDHHHHNGTANPSSAADASRSSAGAAGAPGDEHDGARADADADADAEARSPAKRRAGEGGEGGGGGGGAGGGDGDEERRASKRTRRAAGVAC